MRLRNQLLAILLLGLFGVVGFFYFRIWVNPKPFAVIVFLGDGLTAGDLTAARQFEGGADHRLTVQTFPHTALVSNHANDFAVPDDASAATALATGVKVNNGSVAIDPNGRPLQSLLDLARERGRSVGVITNGSLADATMAAFYAHAPGAGDPAALAKQFADAKIDVALGGGALDFLPEGKDGRRRDRRDLLAELQNKGRTVVRTKADLENAPVFGTASLVGLFAGGNLAFAGQIEAGSQQPSLSDMVRRAIEFLEYHQGGYFLVVDASLITRAAEQNQGERAIAETIELDHAIATALRYAGPKALIVAVGKHATGGMVLNGYPLRSDHGVALLGKNPAGYPAITWSTGPNGPAAAGTLPAPKPSPTPAPRATEPAAVSAPTAVNNAEDVLAIGIGPGSQEVTGFLDNTQVFRILEKNL